MNTITSEVSMHIIGISKLCTWIYSSIENTMINRMKNGLFKYPTLQRKVIIPIEKTGLKLVIHSAKRSLLKKQVSEKISRINKLRW